MPSTPYISDVRKYLYIFPMNMGLFWAFSFFFPLVCILISHYFNLDALLCILILGYSAFLITGFLSITMNGDIPKGFPTDK